MITLAQILDTAAELLSRAVNWTFPVTATIGNDTLGQITVSSGYFSEDIIEAIYRTPLGEIEHHIPPQTAMYILQECDDWVDAMCIVYAVQAQGLGQSVPSPSS